MNKEDIDFLISIQDLEQPDFDNACLERENKRLKGRCEYLQRSCERKEDEIMSLRDECVDGETYKSRNEKAIEYIKKCRDYHKTYHKEEKIFPDEITSLLMILQGEDNNE